MRTKDSVKVRFFDEMVKLIYGYMERTGNRATCVEFGRREMDMLLKRIAKLPDGETRA